MESHQLSEERREAVWFTLSDLLVDTEISLWRIASRVEDIDIHQLEKIFFGEVALVCGVNGLSTIPLMWDCFDRDELIIAIRQKLDLIRRSSFARFRHKIFEIYCRRRYKDLWDDFVKAWEKRKTKFPEKLTDNT